MTIQGGPRGSRSFEGPPSRGRTGVPGPRELPRPGTLPPRSSWGRPRPLPPRDPMSRSSHPLKFLRLLTRGDDDEDATRNLVLSLPLRPLRTRSCDPIHFCSKLHGPHCRPHLQWCYPHTSPRSGIFGGRYDYPNYCLATRNRSGRLLLLPDRRRSPRTKW